MNEDIRDTHKEHIIFVIVYASIFFLLPCAIGIPITAATKNRNAVESAFIISGCVALFIPIFRSRGHDNRNYKDHKSVTDEDKTTQEYQDYRFVQLASYTIGLLVLLTSIPVFLICEAIF